jgi:glycyl-tRNA synthetase alpha chain
MQTCFSRNYIWLERICMFTQQQKNVYDLLWNDQGVKYHEVFHQAEKEFSAYNFEHANVDILLKMFDMHEQGSKIPCRKKNIITSI